MDGASGLSSDPLQDGRDALAAADANGEEFPAVDRVANREEAVRRLVRRFGTGGGDTCANTQQS